MLQPPRQTHAFLYSFYTRQPSQPSPTKGESHLHRLLLRLLTQLVNASHLREADASQHEGDYARLPRGTTR